MSEYTGVIDKYIRNWLVNEQEDSPNPNAYKFMNAHKNYQVFLRGEKSKAWKRGKEFNKGDVIFTFKTHSFGGEPPSYGDIEGVKLHGILYVMKDEYGYRNWERKWNINTGWNTTSTSWGMQLEKPFIIVIPFKNMLGGFALLNWNTNPFQRK